ncbi:hypothetical protein [Micromonospora sp. NBC_01796]|uniref:hypothetical protein n=1 Tax=Micromonospora sp. NBC_01796 TaxID=2975987 RepID=UPI002DD9E770|nr:hypothetical protein [Micromonospora sp. NBC_01796]WSA83172.1 hypothetical protein OIE47_22455 [Micromonospora sp. NBC_01796]
MIRGQKHRLTVVAALLIAVGSWLGLATPASAAPAPAPNSVTITGDGVAAPLVIRAEGDQEIFAAVLDQVGWLGGTGQTSSPPAGDLGPKYIVTVLTDDVAKQTYDLYPLAKGGPRAYRPTKQPDGTTVAPAWFFGRLSMNETLQAAGVPLPNQASMVNGGIGGGERVIKEDSLTPGKDLSRVLTDLRSLLLLNGAVVVAITICLAGISLLVRRRTR